MKDWKSLVPFTISALLVVGDASAVGCLDADATRLSDNYQLASVHGGVDNVLGGKGIDADAPPGPPSGENWKEDHCINGKLFKVGQTNPLHPDFAVDQRKEVGTWVSIGQNLARYNYGVPQYTWAVFSTGSDVGSFVCWQKIEGIPINRTIVAEGVIKSLSGSCL